MKNTREAALDSEFLALTSVLAFEQTKRMPTHADLVDVGDFVERCRSLMEETVDRAEEGPIEVLNWKKLALLSRNYFNFTPSLSFMYGPLDIVAKQRKEIKRAAKEKIAEKVSATEITEVVEEGDGLETSKQVERVFDHLERTCTKFNEEKKDLPFLKFVLDPISFTHTIENLFHLSFLVRDGHVKLNKKEAHLTLELTEPPTEADYQRGRTRAQSVVKIDYNTWQKMKGNFPEVDKPLVPPNDEIQSQFQKRTPTKSKNKNKKK